MALVNSKAPYMTSVDSKAQGMALVDSEAPDMTPVNFKPPDTVPVDSKAPYMVPVDSEAETYCTDSKILAQLRILSVVLEDCCKTHASQGTDNMNNRDGEQSKNSKRPKLKYMHTLHFVHHYTPCCVKILVWFCPDGVMYEQSLFFILSMFELYPNSLSVVRLSVECSINGGNG